MAYKVPKTNPKEKKVKNSFAKSRPTGNPYEIWASPDGTWTWRVLKKYQTNDEKPYARWFCAVKSPYTYGKYDIGDVYVKDIKQSAMKLSDAEMKEELEGKYKVKPLTEKQEDEIFGIEKDNQKILEKRKNLYNQDNDIRVGDYIKEKNGELTRVTYIWQFKNKGERQVQTGGNGGSYYLGEGYMEYSGGLDSGYKFKELQKTDETEEGDLWFFDKNIAGAGRGKDFKMKFRVWEVK